MDLIRKDTAKQIRNVRKLLKGNQAEVLPDTLEAHENAVLEGLQSFGYWFFMLIILYTMFYVLTVKGLADQVASYNPGESDYQKIEKQIEQQRFDDQQTRYRHGDFY